jgi:hypothetical protein
LVRIAIVKSLEQAELELSSAQNSRILLRSLALKSNGDSEIHHLAALKTRNAAFQSAVAGVTSDVAVN